MFRILSYLLVALGVALPANVAIAGELLRAQELGPKAPLAEARNGYVGRLALTPDHGPGGTVIEIMGHDLPPNETFDLVWRTVEGRWKVSDAQYHGREYAPVGYEIAEIRTDGSGRFESRFAAPEDFGFLHDVVLQRGSRLFTKAGFSIDTTVELSPDHGPTGTPIEVEMTGIGWRQLQNSWLLLYNNRLTGWISAVTTAGSARFAIPAAGSPGMQVIEIVHGEFTFPYRNMQQSPEPDRPQFALEFMITDGEAVLPPAPAGQLQTEVKRLPPPGGLAVTPVFSAVGTPMMVTGAGFEPGERLTLQWTSVAGNRVAGNGWQEWSRPVAEATADADGEAVFRFTTPDDLGGAHRLSAGASEGTHVIVPSAAPLDIPEGPAGTAFTIVLDGVGWTETANIYTVVYDNAYVGYACGFNSQGHVEIPLVATGEPGWHFVDLYPAIYKGDEGRPRNFRLPQLTYAADHPGEDLPRFRFAFEVTPPVEN